MLGIAGFVVYAADAQLVATNLASPAAMAAQATLGVVLFGVGWVILLIALLVIRRGRPFQLSGRLLWASVWLWWVALIPACLGGMANTLWDGFGGIALYGILIAVPARALLIVRLSGAFRVRAGKPLSTILWPLSWAAGISTIAYVVLAGMFFQV